MITWLSISFFIIMAPLIIFGGMYRYIKGHNIYPDFVYDFLGVDSYDREQMYFLQGFIGVVASIPIINIFSFLIFGCIFFSKWLTLVRNKNIGKREEIEREKRKKR